MQLGLLTVLKFTLFIVAIHIHMHGAFANSASVQRNGEWALTLDLPFHQRKNPVVVAGKVNPLIFSAGVDKRIKIRDIESEELIKTLFVPSAGTNDGLLHAIALDKKERYVVVGGDTKGGDNKKGREALNQLYFIDWAQEKLVETVPVSEGTIVDVSLSGNGKFAVTVSGKEPQMGAAYRDERTVTLLQLNSGDKIFNKELKGLRYSSFIDNNYFLSISYRQKNNKALVCFELFSTSGSLASEYCTSKLAGFMNRPRVRVDEKRKEIQLFFAGQVGGRKPYILKYPKLRGVSSKAKIKLPSSVLAELNWVGKQWSTDRQPYLNAPNSMKVHKDGAVIDLVRFNAMKPSFTEAYELDEMPILDVLRFDLLQRTLTHLKAEDLSYTPDGPSYPLSFSDKCKINKTKNRPYLTVKPLPANFCLGYEPDFNLGIMEIALANKTGRLLWRKKLENIIVSAGLSQNKRTLVLLFSSGAMEWRNVKTGDLVLSAYFSQDGSNWVVWDESGYFDATVDFERSIGWLEQEFVGLPRFYSAYQFERFGYSPDKIDIAVKGISKSVPPSGNTLRGIKLPKVVIDQHESKFTSVDSEALLRFQVDPGGTANNSVSVFVNDIPVFSDKNTFKNSKNFSASVPMVYGKNVIHIESLNNHGMGYSKTIVYNKDKTGDKKNKKNGKLRVIAIGVNQYKSLSDKSFTLNYAVNDAQAIASYFQGLTEIYDSVEVIELNDDSRLKPIKANILRALKRLEASDHNDTNIVFIAAHGVNDDFGNYYVLPSDMRDDDLVAMQTKNQASGALLSWKELHSSLSKVLGKRLLILDTCHAGGARGTFSPRSLSYKSASSSYAILAASGEGEYSQELDDKKHGLFTYALLNSLNAEADINRDEIVELEEVFLKTKELTAQFTDGLPNSQTPLLLANRAVRKLPVFQGVNQSEDLVAQLNDILSKRKPFKITLRFRDGRKHSSSVKEFNDQFRYGTGSCHLDYLFKNNLEDQHFVNSYQLKLKDLKRPVEILDREAFKQVTFNTLVIENTAMNATVKEMMKSQMLAQQYDYVGDKFWAVVFKYRNPSQSFLMRSWVATSKKMEMDDWEEVLSTKGYVQKNTYMATSFKHKKEAQNFLNTMNKLIDRCQF